MVLTEADLSHDRCIKVCSPMLDEIAEMHAVMRTDPHGDSASLKAEPKREAQSYEFAGKIIEADVAESVDEDLHPACSARGECERSYSGPQPSCEGVCIMLHGLESDGSAPRPNVAWAEKQRISAPTKDLRIDGWTLLLTGDMATGPDMASAWVDPGDGKPPAIEFSRDVNWAPLEIVEALISRYRASERGHR